jgi:glutamate dehydrogenase (NAD(P)+)
LEKKDIQTPNPLLTCKFSDKEPEFTGYIVINSAIRGKCCGGIRLSPEVSLNETSCLAKNMTLKFAFLGIPLGGAKAGIRITGKLTKTNRKLLFTKVGKILSPFIINGSYVPGPDMGTSDEDIDWLLNAATSTEKNRQHASTALYTSWTMLTSATEALNKLKLKLGNSTAVIEGFGSIGSSSAKVFSEKGAKVIAISTCKGAIYNSKGLDVEKLSQIKEKYGDDVINHYPNAEKITNDELLCLSADILLPCAGSWTINSKNAHRIATRIICPGANIPITDEAEKILFNKSIISLPDFVSNSGAVLGSFMGSMVTEQTKKEIINKHFGKRVSQVIQISQEKGIPPIEVAKKIAMERFHKIKNKYEKHDLKNRLNYKFKSMIPKVYRKIFIEPRAKNIFTQMLHSME